MAEPWIRVHANLTGRPIVWRAVEALAVSSHEAIGLLVQFWGAVSQHVTNGHVGDLPDAQLEAWAGWRGKRGRFAAFVRTTHLDAEGRVREWDEYAGKLEQRRKLERERLRNKRATVAQHDADGTHDERTPLLPTRANDTKRDERAKEHYGASGDAPAAGARRVRVERSYPPEFEATWGIYPKRAGKLDKPGAFKTWTARRREGATAEEMHAGVERYRRLCDATGKIGTELVMQAKTFFGPSECWTEMYELPVAPVGAAPPSPAETLWARYVKIGVNHRLPREEFVRKGEELVRQGAYPSVEAFLDELRVTQPWTIDPKTADRFAVATIAGRLAELPNLQKAS